MPDASRLPDSPEGLRARLVAAERENRRLYRELEQLRSSTSFRVGHALTRAVNRVVPGRRRSAPATGAAGAPDEVPASPQATPPDTGAHGDPTGVPAAPASVDLAASVPGGDPARVDPAASVPGGDPARVDPAPTPPGVPLLPGLGPDGPDAVLLDATELDADAAEGVARRLLEQGHRPTVVHPEALRLDGAQTHAAAAVPAELSARFGPAQTVRAVATGTTGPSLLAREPRPLQLVVDDVGTAEGLPPGPVFVGGTGRSGTWVIGRMLSAHPHMVTVHTELRFHSSSPGFAAVLSGQLTPEKYASLVHRKWFRPKGGSGNAKGLQLLSGNRELRRNLNAFVERCEEDVPGALGQLMLDVVGPFARGRGALRWVETTPDNAAAATALTTVLPTARVVHSVRDGRDVAASVVTMPWGPDTHLEGIEWWAKRLRDAHHGMSRADADRVHTVRLEELLNLDRERAIDELLGFLRYTDDQAVRRYFRREMDGSRGNVGRWRGELDVDQRDAFEWRYRETLAALAEDGVTCLPAEPEAVDQLAGS